MDYGQKIAIGNWTPKVLVKVRFGPHWFKRFAWRVKEGWLVAGQDGMATLMRCNRVRKIPAAK